MRTCYVAAGGMLWALEGWRLAVEAAPGGEWDRLHVTLREKNGLLVGVIPLDVPMQARGRVRLWLFEQGFAESQVAIG